MDDQNNKSWMVKMRERIEELDKQKDEWIAQGKGKMKDVGDSLSGKRADEKNEA